MAIKSFENYAFIDGNNLWRGVRHLGWRLDYIRFRKYLEDKFHVGRAYIFLGEIPGNELLYTNLQKQGYVVTLKETIPGRDGNVKGNCDVDLTLQAMVDISEYKKAVFVTSDGDFYPLIRFIEGKGRLERIISPEITNCSQLLKKHFPTSMLYLAELRTKLEYTASSAVGHVQK